MLTIGIKGTKTETVTNENTADHLGSGDLQVYGTPAMIALMESTALESVEPYLESGTTTVGVHLDVEHLAPSPLGMKIYCESTLIEIDRRMLTFQVSAFDEKGEIGRGTHKRFIVQKDAFLQKALARKTNESSVPPAK